jgi:hypothetical protein
VLRKPRDLERGHWLTSSQRHTAEPRPLADQSALRGNEDYFFGRPATAWQRLQRLTSVLSLPPHLLQRRARSFWTKALCGRVLMAGLLVAKSVGRGRIQVPYLDPAVGTCPPQLKALAAGLCRLLSRCTARFRRRRRQFHWFLCLGHWFLRRRRYTFQAQGRRHGAPWVRIQQARRPHECHRRSTRLVV